MLKYWIICHLIVTMAHEWINTTCHSKKWIFLPWSNTAFRVKLGERTMYPRKFLAVLVSVLFALKQLGLSDLHGLWEYGSHFSPVLLSYRLYPLSCTILCICSGIGRSFGTAFHFITAKMKASEHIWKTYLVKIIPGCFWTDAFLSIVLITYSSLRMYKD